MGTHQRVNHSVHEYPYVSSQTQNQREPRVPEWPSTVSFIGKTPDVIPEPVMSRIHHWMMSPAFPMTSCHDVTSWQHKQLCVPADMAHQQTRSYEKVTNIPKNTLHVTPSPMYLGMLSLSEPSTALLLTKNPNTQVHTISSNKFRHNSSC